MDYPKTDTPSDGGAEIVRLRQKVRDLEGRLTSLVNAGDELFYCLNNLTRLSPATVKDAKEVWANVRSR